ncbi:MAG: D-alanyl-D-alanine carboxypeptidase/D-alanyl-D-alanine-endopeptidase, partial [Actinobacteria bacterium]|nr:D-alanyl-D-alanine carboxypeptidase/D-alanyl-D-alanine-endopeptidase [Actinomycetota bacterium]
KQSGITEVANIIVDDTIFDQQFIHPSWPKRQLNRPYTPPVAGLNLWENLVSVKKYGRTSDGQLRLLVEPWISYLPKDKRPPDSYRQVWVSGGPGAGPGYAGGVDSSTGVDDPGIFFGSVFKSVLAGQSVSVTGDVLRRSVTNAQGQLDSDVVVLDQASTKLTDIIGRANKLSRALCAESLLKRLGVGPGRGGSWASGVVAVGKFLTDEAGAKADQFVIDDGSGLSRKDRLSPAVLVAVLKHMYQRPDAEAFRNSLSIWGRDGTLRKRLNRSALAGRVFAKTGYINGVRSLSGYVHTKRGRWIAFSILMNEVPAGHGGRSWQLRTDICELLINY